MSEEEEELIANQMLFLMKKSKKDRKKVLNTCALVLKAAEDVEDDILDVETLMKVHGGLRDDFGYTDDSTPSDFLV